jgi:hypothetical protein
MRAPQQLNVGATDQPPEGAGGAGARTGTAGRAQGRWRADTQRLAAQQIMHGDGRKRASLADVLCDDGPATT